MNEMKYVLNFKPHSGSCTFSWHSTGNETELTEDLVVTQVSMKTDLKLQHLYSFALSADRRLLGYHMSDFSLFCYKQT